jgi:fatty-acyl-CoA synthase
MHAHLTLVSILERAGQLFPRTDIVSHRPDGSIHRYTYGDLYRRARSLAAVLQDFGLRPGERVATLMWNHHMHLEAYFGIPASGGVLHTLDPRMHPGDLLYIATHAENRFLIVDDVLLPVFEQIKDRVHFERVIVTRFSGEPLPDGWEDYEQLLERSSGEPVYPDLDETAPAVLNYTSGTTGTPKGVIHSHRAISLHSLAISLPDSFSISRADTVLPVMPMFHANAWGVPFAAVMNGSRIVMPGPDLQPERLLDLLAMHEVTLAGGAPSVWLGVIDALEKQPRRWDIERGLRIVVSGSAAPDMLFRRFSMFGARMIHAWGTTETAPIATVSTLKPHMEFWPEDDRYERLAMQGLPLPFMEVRAVDDRGEVPWDGQTQGEVQVRGPWVAANYHKHWKTSDAWSDQGWFHTGDAATIHADGFVKIIDRTTDLITSCGESIDSIDVETALLAHPSLSEAAVITVPDANWHEHPLALVVQGAAPIGGRLLKSTGPIMASEGSIKAATPRRFHES